MKIKTINAAKVREGDTFTENNPPELAGATVWEVDDLPAYDAVAFTMTDRTCASVDRRAAVEIVR